MIVIITSYIIVLVYKITVKLVYNVLTVTLKDHAKWLLYRGGLLIKVSGVLGLY